MKVLHVQETLSPRYGGPAKVLSELARAQAAAGIAVSVLTTDVDHPSGRYHAAGSAVLEDSTVPVEYCSVEFGPMRVSMDLVAYLRRHAARFDLLHIHGLYRFPQIYAAYYARRRGLPYIIRPHGSLDPFLYARSSRSLVLKRVLESAFIFPNLNGASAIHYTAEDERQAAAFLKLTAPSFVVPNGLGWKPYEELPQCGAIRARFGIGDAPLVLFLGRLHPKKGLDLLVESFSIFRRGDPSARLLIVGPDSDGYGDKVRGWIAERGLGDAVVMAGEMHGKDVLQAYVDADVFALPSYTENFGMSVAEAMACGTAVAISDKVNIHGQISAAAAGLVMPCDARAFAGALSTLLGDRELRGKMGMAGRVLVQRLYTWPAIVGMLTDEYKRVLRGGRSPAA